MVFEKSHLKGFPLFDRVDLGCVQVFLRMVRHHLEEGDETQRITGLRRTAEPLVVVPVVVVVVVVVVVAIVV